MPRFFMALVVLLALPLASVTAARADIVVRVSKTTQTMQVFIDGAYTHEWDVSTAARGYSTPSGSFRPQRLEKRWFSQKYDNAPMHNAVFFHGGYAIHGTQHVSQLGRPASHGCIRLAPGNAAELFSLIKQYGPHRTRIVIGS